MLMTVKTLCRTSPEFVLSLFEQIMQDDLKAQHRSIIDRCVQAVYRPYIASGYKGNAPTLTDLQAEIKKQPEPEAQGACAGSGAVYLRFAVHLRTENQCRPE